MTIGKYEREALIDRIDKEGATVGHEIPDEITIDDDVVELSRVASHIRKTGVSQTRFDDIMEFKRTLRQKQNDNRDKIQNAELTHETAEQLAEETIGVERVLNMFQGDDVDSISDELKRNRAQRQKRWQAFLKNNDLR